MEPGLKRGDFLFLQVTRRLSAWEQGTAPTVSVVSINASATDDVKVWAISGNHRLPLWRLRRTGGTGGR